MVNSEDTLRRFLRILAVYHERHGLRLTRQRRLIAEFVVSCQKPFTAEEVIAALQSKRNEKRVARPTVFRCLTEFEEAELLRRVNLNGGKPTYELASF